MILVCLPERYFQFIDDLNVHSDSLLTGHPIVAFAKFPFSSRVTDTKIDFPDGCKTSRFSIDQLFLIASARATAVVPLPHAVSTNKVPSSPAPHGTYTTGTISIFSLYQVI
jgi:hypothetical protein